MQKSLKLLLYLNPDPAHIEDIAVAVYDLPVRSRKQKRGQLEKAVKKVRSLIGNVKRLGWAIYRRDNDYLLDEKDYDLVQEAFGEEGKLKEWENGVLLRPANVRKKSHSITL